MSWPPDALWSKITAIWRHAHGPPGVGEQPNALAALKQIQADFDLGDVELAFIAEYTALDPSSRIIKRERDENAFEIVLATLDDVGLVMPFTHHVVATAWALHTYVFRLFLHTPRLLIWSRGSGYGKTVLLASVTALARHGRYMIAPSGPAIYHWLKKHPDDTLAIDNAENSRLWNDEDILRQVYEGGHRPGGEIPRVINHETVFFPTNAPLIVGTVIERVRRIKFPRQILTRSAALELTQSFEGRDEIFPNDPRFAPVRAVNARWAETFQLPKTIDLPRELRGRCSDNYRVLAAVADSLGYGQTLRAAAIMIEKASLDPEIKLYEDIWDVFEQQNVDGLWTSDLVQALGEIDHGLWATLTNSALYDWLYRERIDPKTIWKIGADGKRRSNKGFSREQFEPVWRKLLGHTQTHPSKIIRLPRHKLGTGGTHGD